MDNSLFYFIIFMGLFLTSFIVWLILSTCLGAPLMSYISSRWNALLDYADRQPSRGPAHFTRRGNASGGGLFGRSTNERELRYTRLARANEGKDGDGLEMDWMGRSGAHDGASTTGHG